jgi:uncharacterized low-complexity protein
MSTNCTMKPIAAAVGTAAVALLGLPSTANADQSSFGMTSLSSGYVVVDAQEGEFGVGKCGESKCGEDK